MVNFWMTCPRKNYQPQLFRRHRPHQ